MRLAVLDHVQHYVQARSSSVLFQDVLDMGFLGVKFSREKSGESLNIRMDRVVWPTVQAFHQARHHLGDSGAVLIRVRFQKFDILDGQLHS